MVIALCFMRICAIIPAYQAERNVGDVTREALRVSGLGGAVFVVDDGSSDRTAERARAAGATVLIHPENRGKGAALRTGMDFALAAGFDVAVTIDADGQHPPEEARRLIEADADPEALVLGIRDLVSAGAPRANQISNRISNFFLSLFAGRPFADTQCGLRRYPLRTTLSLGARDDGYAFEAEILLRAVAADVRVVEVPIRVIYPPEEERLTHFDSVRDPARIVGRVVATLALTRGLRHVPAAPAPSAGARRSAVASALAAEIDPRPSQPTAAPP
ncbi:glycosyltransferase family 2 protein [Sorangium sp. So ce134]